MRTPPPVADAHSLAFVGASFYISGGLIALCAGWLDHQMAHSAVIRLIGLLAILAGLAVGRWAAFIPQWARVLMNFGGTGLVLSLIVLSGGGGHSEVFLWLLCYVPIDSFFFFPWRWALPMLGSGMAATAVACFVTHSLNPGEWGSLIVVALVVSFAIGWLVRSAAKAEWDAETGMLSQLGFDRELAMACSDTEKGHHVLSVAMLGLSERAPDSATRDAQALLLAAARGWSHEDAHLGMWARLRDHEYALIWRGPDIEEQLARCRAELDGVALTVGVTDWTAGCTPSTLVADALSARAFAERSGSGFSRHGLVAARVADLEAAVRRDELEVHYQPIVTIADGTVIGAEALVRWRRPDGTMVRPDDFIPLAEQSGLIVEIGSKVLTMACRAAATWRGATPSKITVNVAGAQLVEPGFVSLVRQTLDETGLDPRRLVLEITEGTAYGDSVPAHRALTRLRRLGVRVAIDDFGTGYSNLGRLATLPVDIIKFDRSFLTDIELGTPSAALLRGLLSLSAELGLATVIEGVETEAMARMLSTLGGSEGQGWLWGRPVPAAEFPLYAKPVEVCTATADRPVPARPL